MEMTKNPEVVEDGQITHYSYHGLNITRYNVTINNKEAEVINVKMSAVLFIGLIMLGVAIYTTLSLMAGTVNGNSLREIAESFIGRINLNTLADMLGAGLVLMFMQCIGITEIKK